MKWEVIISERQNENARHLNAARRWKYIPWIIMLQGARCNTAMKVRISDDLMMASDTVDADNFKVAKCRWYPVWTSAERYNSIRSNTCNHGVDEIMMNIRGEKPSISRDLVSLKRLSTVLRTRHDRKSDFPSALNFHSSRRACCSRICKDHSTSLLDSRCGRCRRATVFEGAISSKRSAVMALYCAVRWSMFTVRITGSDAQGCRRSQPINKVLLLEMFFKIRSTSVVVIHELVAELGWPSMTLACGHGQVSVVKSSSRHWVVFVRRAITSRMPPNSSSPALYQLYKNMICQSPQISEYFKSCRSIINFRYYGILNCSTRKAYDLNFEIKMHTFASL